MKHEQGISDTAASRGKHNSEATNNLGTNECFILFYPIIHIRFRKDLVESEN